MLWAISHPYASRPRWWVRCFVTPFRIKRGRGSKIRPRVRLDIFPWHSLCVGSRAIIEHGSTLNNGMGGIHIGARSRVGLNNTVIGPVSIGADVHLAQNIVISALNHNFSDPSRKISEQGVTAKQIVIEDDVWIGANVVITAGVRIGSHSVIGAGSVVTRDIPPGSLAYGVPAMSRRGASGTGNKI